MPRVILFYSLVTLSPRHLSTPLRTSSYPPPPHPPHITTEYLMGQNYSIPINQKHPELVELNAFYDSVHLQGFPAHSIVHKRYSKLMRTVMFTSLDEPWPVLHGYHEILRNCRLEFRPRLPFLGRIAHHYNKTQPSLILKVCRWSSKGLHNFHFPMPFCARI